MISQKGKRKLIYKDKLFYWFVKADKDKVASFLHIVSGDRKLRFLYRVNQISDEFIHAKVCVLQSEKLRKGMYPFFPPIADESISAHNVRAILHWYEQVEENTKPIEEKAPKNEAIIFENMK